MDVADQPPSELTDLHVKATLGEGGMGRVHLAWQKSLRREVAVKVVRSEIAAEKTHRALVSEGRIMGALEHPNVIPVHALGLDDQSRPVLVMKRIDGVPWDALLREPHHEAWSKLDVSDPLEAHLGILIAITHALEFAHGRGIIHRDIKPENVMIGDYGDIYLVDWGVARVETAAPEADVVGTPAYLAPEMVMHDIGPIDARTDVYLLGATLHEVLTGTPPHVAQTLYAALIKAFESTPQEYGDHVPRELAQICRRSMARLPKDRYATVRFFREALKDFLRHRSSVAMSNVAGRLIDESRRTLEEHPELTELSKSMTEGRFALMHALREWPENTEAQARFDDLIGLEIELALRRRDSIGARASAAQMDHLDTKLGSRIETLERQVAAEHARLREMERKAREQDLTVGAKARAALYLSLLLFSAVATASIFGLKMTMTHEKAIAVAAALLAMALIGGAIGRRTLLENEAGRRTFLVILAMMVVLVLHRLATYRAAPDVAVVLIGDMVLLSGMAACAALTILPAFSALAIVFGSGSIASGLWPHAAPQILSITGTAAAAAAAWVWSRQATKRSSPQS